VAVAEVGSSRFASTELLVAMVDRGAATGEDDGFDREALFGDEARDLGRYRARRFGTLIDGRDRDGTKASGPGRDDTHELHQRLLAARPNNTFRPVRAPT
jgi:hypothetical protein